MLTFALSKHEIKTSSRKFSRPSSRKKYHFIGIFIDFGK
ncbi:hypothetical protein HMPREF9296_2024 [Prevotella disiens FB035-09AN]|uniref:Uncharacterized protein n=1 Tax=Prevotella disiens FB035-09AN TaxID=866771 RepID=E1KMS8_9BACT|nr:hypothetical protein HMPREF9296_2024 [Prevotella disiens FB035-09AN]